MQPTSTKRPAPTPDEELEFYRLVRRSVEPGILLLSANGQLISLNEPAKALLGPRAETWVGATLETLPSPLTHALRIALSDPQLAREQTVTLEPPGPDLDRRVLWLNAFLTEGGPATPSWLVVTLHDLAAARELERFTTRLHQLANAGLLSAGVAHEVKNAMVAVKTHAELLLEDQPDSESATLVHREISRINTLIGQLLQLAAPTQAVSTRVHLHEVLAHALRLVHHRLRERDLEQVVLLEAAEDRILGNAKQLEQAFLNLLFNAAEAMGPRGRLIVRTDIVVATEHVSKFEPGQRQRQLQVEIRDSGPGIATELLDVLFKPFVTTKPGGTGLGLTVTRRIIQEHRGSITVETKPGEGTCFRVLLPLIKGRTPDG